MTSLRIPPIEWVKSPAPTRQPLAHFERTPTSVELGLAGFGIVRVTSDAIQVLAPDEVARHHTVDRLGEWGRAQWLTAQGFMVTRGACVASEGKAVVLLGSARCGASVIAFILSRRGWGLVSDGLVVIDSEHRVRALEPEITLDANAISELPPEVPRFTLATGRDRVRLPTAHHPDADLGAYVFLKVKHSATERTFTHTGFDSTATSVIEKCRIHRLFGEARSPIPAPPADFWTLTRPTFLTDPDSYSPPALASLLIQTFSRETGA